MKHDVLIWGVVLVALVAAGCEITRAKAAERACKWDNGELQLTVDELYELREQCCSPTDTTGESCNVPIYGTDC